MYRYRKYMNEDNIKNKPNIVWQQKNNNYLFFQNNIFHLLF